MKSQRHLYSNIMIRLNHQTHQNHLFLNLYTYTFRKQELIFFVFLIIIKPKKEYIYFKYILTQNLYLFCNASNIANHFKQRESQGLEVIS